MPSPESDLKKIAALAYLNLDETNAHQLAQDLDSIMHFIEQLRDVDTTQVSPLLHPLDIHQRLRIDKVNEDNVVVSLKQSAPLFADGLYLVPKVIGK